MTWLSKKPIIALAPMADMTDSAYCCVCREVAGSHHPVPTATSGHPSSGRRGQFVIFREMVSAEAIVRGNPKTLKMCEFEEIERPIVIQIFGGKPEVITEAAKIIVAKYYPDGIDINMGCPVPKIAGKGQAGAALMKDHNRAVAIVKALKSANLGLPVTVKTRLGWSAEDEILTFAKLLEEAGVDGLSIHGRTKKQGYSGTANWEIIAKVKKLVKIPVIANGDINSAEDIEECLKITKADGVMIGRAALGNPWIFSSVIPTKAGIQSSAISGSRVKSGMTIATKELKKVVLRHAELHIKHYGEEYGLKTFRKHLLCYFKGQPGMKEIKQELVKVTTLAELKTVLKKVK